MNLIKQPNRWSCGPTALAMLLDTSVERVIKDIGHDGSEIITTDPDPFCRRAFHLDELQDVLIKSGLGFVIVEADPVLYNGLGSETRVYKDDDSRDQRIINLIQYNRGCLIGQAALNKPHMVAFESLDIYDPLGTKYKFLDSGFFVDKILILAHL